jgi:hypothetical protein
VAFVAGLLLLGVLGIGLSALLERGRRRITSAPRAGDLTLTERRA